MPLTTPVPLPLERPKEATLEERRLWIGNLDTRITEFQLLKLLQQHGTIEKFDLLFHRSGPLTGQPRGYAFATFKTNEDAQHVKELLDGKKLGSKHAALRWAHSMTREEQERPNVAIEIPALAGAKDSSKISRSTKIRAIEAKLKMMEHSSSGDFQVTNTPSTSNSGMNLYYKQQQYHTSKPNIHRRTERYKTKPYHKR